MPVFSPCFLLFFFLVAEDPVDNSLVVFGGARELRHVFLLGSGSWSTCRHQISALFNSTS